VTADYVIFAFIYACAGFILYGLMPVLFSYIGLTDKEYIKRKKERMKNKKKSRILKIEKEEDSEHKGTPAFTTTTDNKEKFLSANLDEEDDRLSK
jgi:hypothetical protein